MLLLVGVLFTGIVDHDVLLPDIEPGRTYHFIVQGTTADGTATTRIAGIDVTGRMFRFDIDESTGGHVGAVEIRVFGHPG